MKILSNKGKVILIGTQEKGLLITELLNCHDHINLNIFNYFIHKL
ncbi:hypothetical protein HMPREF1705_04301 [Acetomicrobium hydrogeniformans ATCC BAA-1850]|uniref:Uncharacterized protein n=1 Tax=Acetomicrobium hydrogeniformans ATCC BAA-1850 TaxID=592015 RepID=A0A0T5X9I0_9BACT|nr:hypothetical protein HMPREF1705_04301 [Acetomicrobium hydrogeniformans ATCC BAA-1850]